MEYFVSAESHPSSSWQLELLIQSFKENKCEDKLSIVVSELDVPQNAGKNLAEHKRLFGYKNIGDIRGYKPLSQIYNLLWALLAEQVRQPFVYLQPDMVLRSQIDIRFSDYPEFVFYPDPFFTFEKAQEEVGPFHKWLKIDTYHLQWVPVGQLFISNQIPLEIFNLVAMRTELFVVHQLLNNKPVSEQTLQVALATVLSDYVNKILCRGDYSLLSPIMAGSNSPFISYEHGILPDFHKSMFSYLPPAYVSLGDPIKILSETYPTPNAHYVSKLAEKNLHSRNKGLE